MAEQSMQAEDVHWCRQQFPALSRVWNEKPLCYLDGPAGTQVPTSVMEAMSRYLSTCNANRGGLFPTARESDAWLDASHQAVAQFLGTDDGGTVCFGPNMTTLTMAVSRALSRTWRSGDEILLTHMEHDANYTPWVLAARDVGVTVRYARLHPDKTTLDLADWQSKLSSRTRLVAIGCASNAIGTRNPVQQMCRLAREAGAVSFLDAVHFAPHDRILVSEFGCDLLACSAYKFFGPHLGILWGRRELLESLEAYKLRPAPNSLPGKWMTGTASHEAIVGTMAAVDYLAALGQRMAGRELSRPEALDAAFAAIVPYERQLLVQLLDGLESIRGLRIWGLTDRQRLSERVATVACTHPRLSSREVAQQLGEQGICVWHGNYYALPLTESLGVEPEGMVRIGLVHYNTTDDVQRVVEAMGRLV